MTPALERFRAEIRSFFATTLPEEIATRGKGGFHTRRQDMQFWARALHARGWSAPHWPTGYGGPGWSPLERYIFEEEAVRAGAPRHGIQGLTLIGPVIYTFGSPEQKARYLPPILRGEEIWAQGFSEPGAGSDLASLRTRASPNGDGWTISGQKIWTSEFHIADNLYLLARTDAAAKPQMGLSLFVMDARAPGISSHPIIGIDGAHSLNAVFLDDVKLAGDSLVGEVNKGWDYAKFLLANERAWAAEVPRIKRLFDWACDLLPDDHTDRLHDELVDIRAEIQALEGMTLWALTQEDVEPVDWPIGNVLKIHGSELQQRLGDLLIGILGDYAQLHFDPHGDNVSVDNIRAGAGAVGDALVRRAASIYGGANEVQRDIIARHVLGRQS